MYLGPRTLTQKVYRTRYHVGIGDLPAVAGVEEVVRHFYRCDHCGWETAGQVFQADEPFFCGQCPRLISLEAQAGPAGAGAAGDR